MGAVNDWTINARSRAFRQAIGWQDKPLRRRWACPAGLGACSGHRAPAPPATLLEHGRRRRHHVEHRGLDWARTSWLHLSLTKEAAGVGSAARNRRRFAQEQDAASVYRALAARRQGEDRQILRRWLGPRTATPGTGPRSRIGRAGAAPAGSARTAAGVADPSAGVAGGPGAGAAAGGGGPLRRRAGRHGGDGGRRAGARPGRGPACPAPPRPRPGWFRAAVSGSTMGMVLTLAGARRGWGRHLFAGHPPGWPGRPVGWCAVDGRWGIRRVRSQRELLDAADHELDAATLRALRNDEAGELALVFRARGSSAEQAEQRVAAMLAEQSSEPASAGDVAGEDVVGSAVAAAGSSFVPSPAVPPFLSGRFFVTSGATVTMIAAVLVGVALFATGEAAGVLTGGPRLRRGLRQLAIGAGAAVVTMDLAASSAPPSAERPTGPGVLSIRHDSSDSLRAAAQR